MVRLPWVPRGPKRKPARSMVGLRGRVAKIVGMECKMEVLQEDVNKLDGKFAVHHDMSHTECRQAMVLK